MSNSVRPHKWQPIRLHCPWDSPGKNTGLGCHFFLQCMKVKSESEVVQSYPTLCDPMDCSPPGSSKSTGMGCHCLSVDENLVSQCKRGMENLHLSQIWGLLTGKNISESPENWSTHYHSYVSVLRQKAGHQMNYYWQFTQSRPKGHCGPLGDQEGMWSLRSCLVDAGRMLLLMVEWVFLPQERFGECLIQIRMRSMERGGQRTEKIFG